MHLGSLAPPSSPAGSPEGKKRKEPLGGSSKLVFNLKKSFVLLRKYCKRMSEGLAGRDKIAPTAAGLALSSASTQTPV